MVRERATRELEKRVHRPSNKDLNRDSIPLVRRVIGGTGTGRSPERRRSGFTRVSSYSCSVARSSVSQRRAAPRERMSPWLSLAITSTRPRSSIVRASFPAGPLLASIAASS